MINLQKNYFLAVAVLLLAGCGDDSNSGIAVSECDNAAIPANAVNCECADGNWVNCTISQNNECDESQKPADATHCECVDGTWENCTFTEDSSCDESQKPEGAITCECVDGTWENCTFTEDSSCDESQKPEDAITCECVDGTWENCTFTGDSSCDESQKPEDAIACECVDGNWINCITTEPLECDETQKPADASNCECVDGNWVNCSIPAAPTCDESSKPADALTCECIDGNWVNCTKDTTEKQLLKDNIVLIYHPGEKELQPPRHLNLLDFSAKGYESIANTEFTKNGKKSFKWEYTTKSLTFPTPRNLAEYDTLRFDVYVPESSVGQTFYMYFQSEDNSIEGMDYYGKTIKLEKSGWNTFEFTIDKLSKSRSPLGWDQIDKLVLTSTGWNQNNNTSSVIYLGNMQLISTPALQKNDSTKIIDFSSDAYKANASTTYTKTGKKSFEWKFTTANYTFSVPKDLSAYKTIDFWVYVPKASKGATFYMYFSSENPATTDGIDYYGRTFALTQEGWMHFSLPLNKFSTSRTPLGWNQIDKLVVTSTGWSQNNNTSTIIYLDDIYLNKSDNKLKNPIPELSGAVFSINGARAIVDGKLINNGYDDDTARVFMKDNEYWLPLTVFGARYDDKSTYHRTKQSLEMTLNGKKYQFEGGKNSVSIDGKASALDFMPIAVGTALFAPMSYIKQLMGYTKEYKDEMGMVYLSKSGETFTDLTSRLNLMYETLFMRPTATEAVAQMFNHLGGDIHPRVMMTQDRFDELKKLLETDKILQSYYNALVKKYGPDSNEFAKPAVVYNITDGKRLLSISREAKNRIIPWAFLYKMTGDAKYAMRIWQDVEALINFQDWHPSHYLDTAEILYPMAIAYDWLYDVWTPNQRERMETATKTFGLNTGLDRYEGRASHWGNNNWTGVCNGGLTAAAIAYANAPITADAAQRVLNYSMQDYEDGMYTYAPDGGYLESPGYWSYGTDYLHVLISSLDSATGSTQGIYYSPGFAQSAYFTTYFENEAGSWGFHDSGSGQTDTNCQSWFARKSGDPSLGRIRQNAIENGLKSPHIYDLMWYAPGQIGDKVNLNLDAYYSQVGSVTMRSSWDKGAILIGLHGGANNASHGDLDIGNFVLYAAGKVLLMDLGSDNYNLPDYFGTKREYYYKKRAEGQNTLVIGDVSYEKPDQVKNTIGHIEKSFGQNSSFATVDMSTAYTTVKSGTRGVWFKDNRSTVVLQDEISLDSEQIVRWGVHAQTSSWYGDSGEYLNKCVKKDTIGEIKISNDGRSATITRTGADQHLYAEIVSSDTSLKFTKELARSYDKNYPNYTKYPERPSYTVNLPGHETQYEHCRIGIEKLAIITPKKVKSFNVAVVFKMVNNDASDPAIGKTYTWTDMAKWTVK